MPPGHPTKLVKQHPGAFVVVTGCYAQLKPETVAKIEGVDVVLGAEQKKDLLHYLAICRSTRPARPTLPL